MTDAIFTAENHGVIFSQENDGWYWTMEGDCELDELTNGPFPTKDLAAQDAIGGADNIE